MSGKSLLCACALVFLANLAWGSNATEISYSTTSLGGSSWQYNYKVSNISLGESVKEFTINFAADSCRNLAVVAPTPAGWSAIVMQPEPFLHDAGAYDALTVGGGILGGQSVSGFSVRFDWLGAGTPGSQLYQIVNPVTFATIDSGATVPEPATLSIMTLGSLVLSARRSRRASLSFKG
jgi:hypothetical protein